MTRSITLDELMRVAEAFAASPPVRIIVGRPGVPSHGILTVTGKTAKLFLIGAHAGRELMKVAQVRTPADPDATTFAATLIGVEVEPYDAARHDPLILKVVAEALNDERSYTNGAWLSRLLVAPPPPFGT